MRPPQRSTALVKAKSVASTTKPAPEINRLYKRVCEILEASRQRVARTVNTEMVQAYWLIGQAIVEQEQKGKKRAGYGEHLIEGLSARMRADGQKGFDKTNLWHMRKFHLQYPNFLDAVRRELSWTHYRLLLKVESDDARAVYETEAAAAHWGTRELERQINSFFFERTALSKQKRQMLERGRTKGEKYAPQDFIKDPVVLEFLQWHEVPQLTESQIETALCSITCKNSCLNLAKASHEIKRQISNRKKQKWDSEAKPFLNFLDHLPPFCLLPFEICLLIFLCD